MKMIKSSTNKWLNYSENIPLSLVVSSESRICWRSHPPGIYFLLSAMTTTLFVCSNQLQGPPVPSKVIPCLLRINCGDNVDRLTNAQLHRKRGCKSVGKNAMLIVGMSRTVFLLTQIQVSFNSNSWLPSVSVLFVCLYCKWPYHCFRLNCCVWLIYYFNNGPWLNNG